MEATDKYKIVSGALEPWMSETERTMGYIEKIPAVEAEPVVHGHWIVGEDSYHRDDDGRIMDAAVEGTCSKCRKYGGSDMPYCPWCGAKMDEVVSRNED